MPKIHFLPDDKTVEVAAGTSILQAALDNLMSGRTTLTIAHRLSTVRNADQIVVLDGGRVVERGSHEVLLHSGGRYASLSR